MQDSALESSILLLQATGGDYLGLTGPYMSYVVSSGTVTDPMSYRMYQTQVCYIFSNTVLLTSRVAVDLACQLCSMCMLWLGFDSPTCILRADQEISSITKASPVRLDHLSLVFVCFASHVFITRHSLLLCKAFVASLQCIQVAVRLQSKDLWFTGEYFHWSCQRSTSNSNNTATVGDCRHHSSVH